MDCPVRFLMIVRQSPVHDIIGCQIRHIDERNSPAQIRECKNALRQSARIALRRAIRIDDFHYIRLAQRPFRGAGVESANLIVGERVLLAGNGFQLNRPIEHGSQSTHLKTHRRIFVSPRPHPLLEFFQIIGVDTTEREMKRFVPIKGFQYVVGVQIGIGIAGTPPFFQLGDNRFVDLLNGLRLDALLLFGYNRLRGKFFLVDFFRQNLAVVFGFVFQYDLTNQLPIRTVGFGLIGVEIPEFRIDRHAQTFHRAAALFGNAEHQRGFSVCKYLVPVTNDGNGCFHRIRLTSWLTFSRQPWRQPLIFGRCG